MKAARRWGLLSLLVVLWLLTLPLRAQASDVLVLTDETTEYELGHHLAYLADPTGELTIDEIASPAFNGRFQPSPQENPSFGFTSSAYWFRLRVRSETERPLMWRLEITNALLDRINLFVPTAEPGQFSQQQAGNFVPLNEQQLNHHFPVFVVTLRPQVEKTLYLRIEESSSLTFGAVLWPPEAFIHKIQREQLILGLNFGVLLIMLGYNLFLYFFLRQRSYLYYVLFIGAYTLGEVTASGLGRQYLWPNAGLWNDLAGPMLAPLAAISFLLFTSQFLRLPRHLPRYYRFITWLIGAWALLLIFIPWARFIIVIPVLLLLLLVSIVTAVVAGFILWRQHYRPARFFLLAWLTPLLGGVVFILSRIGWLPHNLLTEQSPRLGVALMALLLSVALADEINRIRRQRENALAVATRLNEELEERVIVRTAELAATNQNLTQLIHKQERTQAALRRHASQLEALREINLDIASKLELPVLLQSIVSRAAQLVKTKRGGLFLWQADRQLLELVSTTRKTILPVGLTLPAGEGIVGRVWQTGQPMMVEDYSQWTKQVPDVAAKIGATAVICVPIFWHEERMGVLSITDRSQRTFSAEDVELLSLFAMQAAVAIQNARLLAQIQQNTQRLEAEIFERRQAQDGLQHYREHLEDLVSERTAELATVNKHLAHNNQILLTLHAAGLAVTSSLNLQEVLDTVSREMAQLLNITTCDILTWDREARTMHTVAGYRTSVQLTAVEFETFDLTQLPVTEQVLEEKEVIQMTFSQPDIDPGEWRYMQAEGVKTMLMLPIIFQNESLGLLSLEDKHSERTFSDEEIALAKLLSYQAANAIENARLYDQARQLIAELERKNEDLERFTYTVSHDLKSPLVTVKGFLGFLEKDAAQGDMARLKQDVQRIREATTKMELLLNDLLSLSRVGRLINTPQPVPFSLLVQEAVELAAGQIAAADVEIVIAPNMPIVNVDPARLVEVLQNLTDNAVKFMGDQPQPRVEFGWQPAEPDNVFFVRDNGIGIDAKYHEKVFGLFERLDESVIGTGIGLALVKRIIEAHNGRIWIESDGQGRGTTFYFTLPSALEQ